MLRVKYSGEMVNPFAFQRKISPYFQYRVTILIPNYYFFFFLNMEYIFEFVSKR